MDNDIKEIKHYIEIKDYNSLEEFLGVFMIPTKKLQNENFDILCYSIECGCNEKIINQIFEWYFIPILVKYQYVFSRNDFNLLFQNDFDSLILTFEEITLFNKNIENKYNNNYDDDNNNNNIDNKLKERKKIIKKNEKKNDKEINKKEINEKENKNIFKHEINIYFMWYIYYFRKREFNKILELFKYETSEEHCRGLKFFDYHFNYLDKKCENDIKLQFLYEIINKHVKIPKFQHENKKEFINEIHLRNQFNRILIRKHELYSKYISNNDYSRIKKFKKNNKFFFKYMQKPPQ
ncbi:hypothetical protein H8356DRAFT_1283698 [Neocallimastix lanati (nom. inval.)]|uniref:Uncharacterized protein n=1 Tax=Neocallimastix californiae TaxID=1754190 RepID=A0A1Y2A5V0_9FUNG|nr:hypothetical protein H8356DRAFT_1283698 [Neocallimastix sp. JGI-2020a]ORY17878.1 hypothetical protein LY90DRAFT_517509 [Neocallimastix californiae]|eukprot:ORY17878.1 hypothetical protein LY90DRAFT_517509 [Neocallimastix californiae]